MASNRMTHTLTALYIVDGSPNNGTPSSVPLTQYLLHHATVLRRFQFVYSLARNKSGLNLAELREGLENVRLTLQILSVEITDHSPRARMPSALTGKLGSLKSFKALKYLRTSFAALYGQPE